MRIAYISLHWARDISSGVGKKMTRQIQAWRNFGHEVKFFMHSVEHAPDIEVVAGEAFYYAKGNLLQTEMKRIRAAKNLVKAVRAYQPDIIYLRYGIYVFPLHQLASIAPIIIEINTNDVTQHKDLGSLYALYNRLTRGIMFRLVKGMVSVSYELMDMPVFSGYKKEMRVIPNGIDLSAIQPLPAPQNSSPRILFSGSPGCSWHGVDKLIGLAKQFPDLTIELIGGQNVFGGLSVPPNLKMPGYLCGDAYRQVLARVDIAIATMALHREDMEEASPLKTREYLAYGIPTVLPYQDSDLRDVQADFLLRIPNAEDNILTHGAEIYNFARAMRGRRVNREQILMIDNEHKEQERLRFFEEIFARYGKKK